MPHGDRGELESSMCEAAMSGGTKEGGKRSCECEQAGLSKVLWMEPVIYGSKSVCIEISFESLDFGEANKRTRKYRGDPQNGEKPCAADGYNKVH